MSKICDDTGYDRDHTRLSATNTSWVHTAVARVLQRLGRSPDMADRRNCGNEQPPTPGNGGKADMTVATTAEPGTG